MTVTLLQLNTLVQRAVSEALPANYWLTAELASWSVRNHAYGELVEKDEAGRTLASAKCSCWQSTVHGLAQKFYQATGGQLRPGLKVLLLVRATFHPQYGFAYNILDIDPTYTIGDSARRRQEILRELQRQGIMRLNELNNPLPPILQRIAIISSPTAAGYGDFVNQLQGAHVNSALNTPHSTLNTQHSTLRFYPTLFPATMQGNEVEASVMAALSAIAERQEEFDCVVIIRGGGAVTDLDYFDNYRLAEAVALFPLPIFTGIGHERDEVVLDFVAHTRLKTPTAVAAFLIDHNMRQVERIVMLDQRIRQSVALHIERGQTTLERLHQRMGQAAQLRIEQGRNRLDTLSRALPQVCLRHVDSHGHRLQQLLTRYDGARRLTMQRQQSRLDMLEQRLRMLDPQRILNRGYSYTTCGGVLVTDAAQLTSGDTITTTLAHGTVTSQVE